MMRIAFLSCLVVNIGLCLGARALPQEVVKEVLRYERSDENLLSDREARPFEAGFELDEHGFCCDNGDDASAARGVSYWVELKQTRPEPIRVELSSQCENVSGSPDSGYSLYVDLTYDDGTPLWGQSATFDTGTHMAQMKSLVIFPEKPVRSLVVYGLLRGKSGKAWFRDFRLSTLAIPKNAGVFDTVPVIPRKHAMLQIRDVKNGSDFFALEDNPFGITSIVESTELFENRFDTLTTVTLQSDGTKDHCVTLVYALPVSPENLLWCEHPRKTRKVEPNGEYMLTNMTAAGANGKLSYYPFAAVTTTETRGNPRIGSAVGIDLGTPAFFRTGYNAVCGELFVAVDVALTPESPTATLRFVRFGFDGYRDFRAALAEYYRIFPEYFICRAPEQGNWMPFAKISDVPDYEDFGFKFKEGDNEIAWDDAHDIITFRYTEPMTWWMAIPKDVTHDDETALATAKTMAESGNAYAKALLTSGMHDKSGKFVCQLLDTPWCHGAVWSVNDMPGIANGSFALKWSADIAERLYGKTGTKKFEGLDGEYVDSSEGYVTAELDFNRDHFAAVETPLTFSKTTHEPAIYRGLVAFEYCRKISDDIRVRDRLMMANSTPDRLCWLAPLFDVMGTETNWNHDDRWSPMPDEQMLYRRAMCGPKPFCFLMNTDFDKFTYDMSERFMKRSLAYGMFPGYFSADASTGHYFTRPELYERDRELFKKYVPLCKKVAEAGWQPITWATTNNEKIYIERFGADLSKSIYTVFNDSEETVDLTIRFRFDRFPLKFVEAVTGESKAAEHGRLILTLEPEGVAVLVPEP